MTGLFCAGEKLQDTDVDSILKFTGTEEDLDGNIKYEGTNYLSAAIHGHPHIGAINGVN